MSETDTSNQATTTTSEESKLVDAQVIAGGGISYFVREPLLDPFGEQAKNPDGSPAWATTRQEARFRDIVQLSPYEFQRQKSLGAVQEPGSAPLVGDPGWRMTPTPFGAPQPIDDEGTLAYPEGPIMGEPSPSAADTTDSALLGDGPGSGAPLTAAQAAELERQARGDSEADPEGDEAEFSAWMESGDKDDLKSEAESRNLTVARSDGRTDREPTKEDYARALVQNDKEGEA